METLTQNYKTVCNKYDICLKRNKIENIFTIFFQFKNKNIDVSKFINFKLYELLYELNKDILEDVRIINYHSNDEIDILFLFKQFGKELGITKKYMYIKTVCKQVDNLVTFSSKSVPYEGDIVKGYDNLYNNFSELSAQIVNNHHVNMLYKFNIDMHENLPIYMENMIGILMKKIFYRLKTFIENVK